MHYSQIIQGKNPQPPPQQTSKPHAYTNFPQVYTSRIANSACSYYNKTCAVSLELEGGEGGEWGGGGGAEELGKECVDWKHKKTTCTWLSPQHRRPNERPIVSDAMNTAIDWMWTTAVKLSYITQVLVNTVIQIQHTCRDVVSVAEK